MSPRQPARRRLRLPLLGACAALALVLLLPRAAGADGEDEAALRARLTHPLAAVREGAVRHIAADASGGKATALALVRDRDPAMRLAGWRVLAVRPAWLDADQCRLALADDDARVGVAAAEAFVAAASTGKPPPEALLPAGCWGDKRAAASSMVAHHALSIALADAIERAPAERVPSVVFALGQGAVPALGVLARSDRYHNRIRSLAVTLIGRIGGDAAADTLLSLIQPDVLRDRSSAFSALSDMPLDAKRRARLYETLHQRDVPFTRWSRTTKWGAFFRGGGGAWRGWMERSRIRHLARVHPPTHDVDGLRTYYIERLAQRRRHPTETIDCVQGLIAIDGMGGDEIDMIVGNCFEPMWRGRWRSRTEELGSIVIALYDLKQHRKALKEALRDLFDIHDESPSEEEPPTLWQTDLPRTVEAWGHFVLGTERVRLEAMATELVRGSGEVPIWSARRLGARLWSRLGNPPADLARELLADGDAWMRRQGLAWLRVLPAEEREAAIRRALSDEDDGVFTSAAALEPKRLKAAGHRRLLRLALEGSRTERRRAWALLRRAAPKALPADMPAHGDAALDWRLTLIHTYRTHLGLGEDLPAGR